jgi:hypothetical protein
MVVSVRHPAPGRAGAAGMPIVPARTIAWRRSGFGLSGSVWNDDASGGCGVPRASRAAIQSRRQLGLFGFIM